MANISVTVSRFQVDNLTSPHRYLLNECCEEFDKCILFLGCTDTINTFNNPLTFEQRKQMIQEYVLRNKIIIIPIYDCASNEFWVEKLDMLIEGVTSSSDKITMIGGRDSYLKEYEKYGKQKTIIHLHNVPGPSGTEVRKSLAKGFSNDYTFRQGVIWAAQNRYPTVYTTVDIAIMCEKTGYILMGKKKQDDGRARFIGGFLDKKDITLEHAACRELEEESGLCYMGGDLKKIGTYQVQDYRYKNESDSIMTHFFLGVMWEEDTLISAASDDMDEVEWVDILEMPDDYFVESHMPLVNDLREHIQYMQDKNK